MYKISGLIGESNLPDTSKKIEKHWNMVGNTLLSGICSRYNKQEHIR